jgi:hypothetical protein
MTGSAIAPRFPARGLTDCHFLGRQNGLDLRQRDIRLLRHQLPTRSSGAARTYPLYPPNLAGLTLPVRGGAYGKRTTELIPTPNRSAVFRNRGTILLRHHHACPQILRIRLTHPILASVPVRILSPIRVPSGIPTIHSFREQL